MVRLIPFKRVGMEGRDRSFTLLAVAAEFRAGDAVGLGLGAACGEVEPDLLLLGRIRHFYASRQGQHTPAPMSHMSQMDYLITLFQSHRDP